MFVSSAVVVQCVCWWLFLTVVIIIISVRMKGTKVHNPRAILSLLKLILFLVHEFTQELMKEYPNYMQYT